MRAFLHKPACWVFLILLLSNAFFWHSRDWNTASRLMLVYSLVDRGTISITGLEDQTGDRARFQGQYYSDKPPGFPLLAAAPYLITKLVLRIPSHPLGGIPLSYWAADYWVTLFSSGVLTALHRRTPGLLVALPWLSGRPRCTARLGVRSGNSGLRLCDSGQRPPADRVCPLHFVLSALAERVPQATGPVVFRRFPGSLCGCDRASSGTGLRDSGVLSPVPVRFAASAAPPTWLLSQSGGRSRP